MRDHISDHTGNHTSDHTDADMFGPDTHTIRTLSLVPALAPDSDMDSGTDGDMDAYRDGGVDGGVSARPAHRPARRRASGPGPVRPAATAGSRQAPVCRTVSRVPAPAWPEQQPAGRERVLERSPQRVAAPLAWRFRVRRAVAGVVAVLVTAAVVVGLGLLADAASAARHTSPAASVGAAATPGEVVVTVRAGESLGDIVRRAVPGLDDAALTAAVERTVIANSLTSVSVRPGQVLRVPVR